MENFWVAVNAVVPFCIYIAFGLFTRSIGLVAEDFTKQLNQMVFRAFFPIMMFYNLYSMDLSQKFDGKLVLTGIGSLFVLIALLCLIVPLIVKENSRCGVMIQAIYRSNFVLFAIPLTESVFGSEGVALASMMVAIVVPIYNVVAVIVLEYFRGGVPKIGQLAKNVLSNPMIMGAIVGLVFFGLHMHLPACVEKPVKAFSDLSTPLALFVLGSTLHFSSIRKNLKYLVSALGLKLVIIPSIIMVLAVKLQFRPVECFVLFAMFATPVAAASYPMAQNMGGDGELAGELVVTSTVVSVFTIFLWIYFLKNIGVF
ncbi:MAG: AEC family transporter [Eubacteriales bacterium]|nr:AEC family transporter [Eubacteriales bacterium]